jgi:amidase
VSGTSFTVEEATIDGIHAAMLAGELRCSALVEAYLQRIDAFDRAGPKLNTIVSLSDQAQRRAAELDAELAATGRLSGPLHGIPVLVKDCIETADTPTTFGSIATPRYLARGDAEVVRRLRAAGAVVLGKTTLCDFAAGWFSYSSLTGDTKNPYEPGRDSGGSSAGSAAAVAANLATIALGTDCGGSVRVPASFCNVVGIRTTPEVVSHEGTLVLVARQDTIGPLARSVADAAALLSVMADPGTSAHAAAAQFSADGAAGPQAIAQARIGVLRDAFGDGHPEMAAVNEVVNRALETAAAAGATLVDVAIPDLRADLEDTSMYLLRSRHDVDTWLAGRPGLSVRTVREIHAERLYDPRLDLIDAIAASPDFSAANPEILRRQAAREAFTAKLEGAMDADQLDLLAYPTVQVFSPLRAGPAEWTTLTFPTNTVIAAQAWMPAMSLPAGLAAGGPVGLELLARQHDEARLLRLGAALERVTRERRPPSSAPAGP